MVQGCWIFMLPSTTTTPRTSSSSPNQLANNSATSSRAGGGGGPSTAATEGDGGGVGRGRIGSRGSTTTTGGAESGTRHSQQQQQQPPLSIPDQLMADVYGSYVPPDPMSGQYKLLDTLEELCEYLLELFEAQMMNAKKNALVLQELARLKSTTSTAPDPHHSNTNSSLQQQQQPPPQLEVSSVLQYDDTDLMMYMSGNMQRVIVLEPIPLPTYHQQQQEPDGIDGGGDGCTQQGGHISRGYGWLCEQMRMYLKQRVSGGI